MVTSLPRLAIVGAGNMGGAILRGILGENVQTAGIRVTTQSEARARALRSDRYEVKSVESDPHASAWAVEGADIIVIAVKPYSVLEVLREFSGSASPDAVVVSVAAGVTLAKMGEVWPGATIRTMPNTPSEVGKGITGVAVGEQVSSEQSQQVMDLFALVGDVLVVPEESLNALSAFSGSGPAFVYYFIENYVRVAEEMGFSADQARTMVVGTVEGALELLEHSGKSPAQLRTEVTSPGGSTAAALAIWDVADVHAVITQATRAAIARAEELAGD